MNSGEPSQRVTGGLVGLRLDKCVKELFDVPWNTARKWIETGKVQVDGAAVRELDYRPGEGDALTYNESARRPIPDGGFDSSCVVYMDAHLLVANKPADLLSVPFEKGERNTFDQQLRGFLKKTVSKGKQRGKTVPALQVVHRLDRRTSGLLVFPRTFEAKEGLARQFRDHSARREYHALVHGIARSGTIRTHLVKDRGDGIRGSRELSTVAKVLRSEKGQVAVTHVTVAETFAGASYVTCRLETGRTNQIRIHLSEQGCPLVGERTYMRDYTDPEIATEKLMLHAGLLGFRHPTTGEQLDFTVPPPRHFEQMLVSLRKRKRVPRRG